MTAASRGTAAPWPGRPRGTPGTVVGTMMKSAEKAASLRRTCPASSSTRRRASFRSLARDDAAIRCWDGRAMGDVRRRGAAAQRVWQFGLRNDQVCVPRGMQCTMLDGASGKLDDCGLRAAPCAADLAPPRSAAAPRRRPGRLSTVLCARPIAARRYQQRQLRSSHNVFPNRK